MHLTNRVKDVPKEQRPLHDLAAALLGQEVGDDAAGPDEPAAEERERREEAEQDLAEPDLAPYCDDRILELVWGPRHGGNSVVDVGPDLLGTRQRRQREPHLGLRLAALLLPRQAS